MFMGCRPSSASWSRASALDEKFATFSDTELLATSCDPRFKQLAFLDVDVQDRAKTLLTELVRKRLDEMNQRALEAAPRPQAAAPRLRYDGAADLLAQMLAVNPVVAANAVAPINQRAVSHRTRAAADLVDQYYRAPALALSLDQSFSEVLKWWRTEGQRWAPLAEVALEYAGIPATSAPSERVFSTAGNTITKKRTNLQPETVEAIVMLHHNASTIRTRILDAVAPGLRPLISGCFKKYHLDTEVLHNEAAEHLVLADEEDTESEEDDGAESD